MTETPHLDSLPDVGQKLSRCQTMPKLRAAMLRQAQGHCFPGMDDITALDLDRNPVVRMFLHVETAEA